MTPLPYESTTSDVDSLISATDNVNVVPEEAATYPPAAPQKHSQRIATRSFLIWMMCFFGGYLVDRMVSRIWTPESKLIAKYEHKIGEALEKLRHQQEQPEGSDPYVLKAGNALCQGGAKTRYHDGLFPHTHFEDESVSTAVWDVSHMSPGRYRAYTKYWINHDSYASMEFGVSGNRKNLIALYSGGAYYYLTGLKKLQLVASRYESSSYSKWQKSEYWKEAPLGEFEISGTEGEVFIVTKEESEEELCIADIKFERIF